MHALCYLLNVSWVTKNVQNKLNFRNSSWIMIGSYMPPDFKTAAWTVCYPWSLEVLDGLNLLSFATIFSLRPSDPLTHFATLRESCYSFCVQSPTSHHKCKWLLYYNTDLLLFICIWDFSVSLLTWYLQLNQFSIDLLWFYFFICFVQIYLMSNAILCASLKNNTETDCG